MNKKEQKAFLVAMETLLSQKGITKEELKDYLLVVFTKTFGRDYSVLSLEQLNLTSEIEDGIVEVIIDLDNFIFQIMRVWKINNEKIEVWNLLKEISTDSEIVLDKELQTGDVYHEEIDLSKISNSKRQQIYQLLTQRTKEYAKEKIFNNFSKYINTIISAKVSKIEENYILLTFENENIFLPQKEISPNDKFKVGEFKKILIIDVNKTSKDSQIISSRSRTQFVKKLIESEIDDVREGIVKIERISREPGFKTKIAVSSDNKNVDPVGSIIGVKGSKIKEITKEIEQEIIDIVKFSEDENILIANLFHPAKVKAVYLNRETNHAAILVNDSEFLQAIGKRGINVKLVAQITGYKIDIVLESKKQNFDFDFKYIKNENHSSRHNYQDSNNHQNKNYQSNFKLEIKSIDEISDEGDRLEEQELLKNNE